VGAAVLLRTRVYVGRWSISRCSRSGSGIGPRTAPREPVFPGTLALLIAQVPDSAREKIAAIRTIGAADSERELALGRELAARVLTGVAQTEDSELLARAKRRDTRFPYGMGVFFVPALYLSHALRARGVRGSRGAFQARRSRSKARQLSSDPSSDIRTIRTIGDFPPRYVADVLRQTGCQPGNSQQLAGVVVRYNEAGHVQELRPVATTLPPACDKAARYISRAGVLPAPWNMKPGARELLLVSMNDAALQCLAEAPSPATKGSTKPAVRVGHAYRNRSVRDSVGSLAFPIADPELPVPGSRIPPFEPTSKLTSGHSCR
jgi:hypothetical protein